MSRSTDTWLAIMAGGIGSRFWPASRPDRPKQLICFGAGTNTLLREAVDRAAVIAGSDRTLVITSSALHEPVKQHIDILSENNILAEPMKRNTLGAVLYATAAVLTKTGGSRDSILGILPADHHVGSRVEFTDDLCQAVRAAVKSESLVTIGIPPTRPDTGYGYIETSARHMRVADVHSFREKPDASTAAKFLEDGSFLWNSGMFFWRISTFMNELHRARPDVAGIAERFFEAHKSGEEQRIRETFAELPDLSIDYALMEDATSVKVVAATFEWDDLGTWDALPRVTKADGDGNVLMGAVVASDCTGCVVYNELTHPIAVMGLQDMVVAVGKQGMLVTPVKRAQSVRELSQNAREASTRNQPMQGGVAGT